MGRFCQHCGKEIIEGSTFCSECGTRVKEEIEEFVCPNCAHENPPDSLFCENCGKKLKSGAEMRDYCGTAGLTKVRDTDTGNADTNHNRKKKKSSFFVLISVLAVLAAVVVIFGTIYKKKGALSGTYKDINTDAVMVLSPDGTVRHSTGEYLSVYQYSYDEHNIVFDYGTFKKIAAYQKSEKTLTLDYGEEIQSVFEKTGPAPLTSAIKRTMDTALDGVYGWDKTERSTSGMLILAFEPNGTFRRDSGVENYSYNYLYQERSGENKWVGTESIAIPSIISGKYDLVDGILTLYFEEGGTEVFTVELVDGALHLFDSEGGGGTSYNDLTGTYGEKEENYRRAKALYKQGKTEEAYAIFSSLDDYMDSGYWCLKIDGTLARWGME